MRGKVKQDDSTLYRRRITPAYAGKSPVWIHLCSENQDHPRLCGEKFGGQVKSTRTKGSPPPMRGKAFIFDLISRIVRITPAYAGKRFRGQRGSKIYKDHPRLCGEKWCNRLWCFQAAGSPPPMRGKVVQSSLVLSSCGITPAYAGKSEYFNVKQIITKDHPRLCGEKGVFQTSHDRAVGSPPPMRGKAYRQKIRHRVSRITPAYAGKSFLYVDFVPVVANHPRLCGEKLLSACTGGKCGGSPPPMRGKVSEKPPFAML